MWDRKRERDKERKRDRGKEKIVTINFKYR